MDRFEAFTGSILELNRYLQKLKDLEMRPYGLRGNHVMCLYYLGKHPEGLTPRELTEVCREDKAAISRSTAQLIDKGLITGDFPEHKRAYRTKLVLTERGRELVHNFDRRIDAFLTTGSSGVTEEQRRCFYGAMEIITGNLSRYLTEIGEN